MVILPLDFVATRYPGYFWNTTTQVLYTIKGTGELKPLKFHPGGSIGHQTWMPGYNVSVNGVRRKLTLAMLRKLKPTIELQIIKVSQ